MGDPGVVTADQIQVGGDRPLFVRPIDPRVYGLQGHLDGGTVIFGGRVDVDGLALLVRVNAQLQSGASYRYPEAIGAGLVSVRSAEAIFLHGETYLGYGQPVLDRLSPRQRIELESTAEWAAEGR